MSQDLSLNVHFAFFSCKVKVTKEVLKTTEKILECTAEVAVWVQNLEHDQEQGQGHLWKELMIINQEMEDPVDSYDKCVIKKVGFTWAISIMIWNGWN